jgi:hypothetical protein
MRETNKDLAVEMHEELVKSIVKAIVKRRGNPERLRQVIRYSELADDLAKSVLDWPKPLSLKEAAMRKAPQSCDVVVDYRLGLRRLLRDTPIERIEKNISSRRFPRPKSKAETVTLYKYSFKREIPSEELLELIHEIGFQPANVYELVSFCKFYPEDCQRLEPIALGSLRGRGEKTYGVALYNDDDNRLCIGNFGLFETYVTRGDCLLLKR